jgi:hypothetical protein
MSSRIKNKTTAKKVAFNAAPKGSSPTVQMAPEDAPVRVAITSLEAEVGYRSLLRQLQKAFLLRVAFFRSEEGVA